jgi:hypothetical protein
MAASALAIKMNQGRKTSFAVRVNDLSFSQLNSEIREKGRHIGAAFSNACLKSV